MIKKKIWSIGQCHEVKEIHIMSKEQINIRQAILNQKTPFCLSDIILRLHYIGIDNKGLILYELDRLFSAGLVTYKHIDDNTFAFCIV